MKIKVKVDGPADMSSLQIWDIYYAYEQFRARHSGYRCDLNIEIADQIDITSQTLNLVWYHGPQSLPEDADDFDLIFVDLGQHSLENCTQAMYDLLKQHDNCYFVCSSYVTRDHPWSNRIIWIPMTSTMTQYLTKPFYPQFWEKKPMLGHGGTKITFLNGQNRVHRQYFMDLVAEMSIDINILNNFSQTPPRKLKSSFFESDDDRVFREFVNRMDHDDPPDDSMASYYDTSVAIGINNKFGHVPPGYFIMDMYHDSSCVVFPETTWLNDTIWPTEKILKCLVSGCIPWPIGGSNTHHLYNELGYQTAWNMLPESMRSFDADTNHQRRYTAQAKAIAWACQHPEIWHSDAAKIMRQQNLQAYFLNSHDGACAAQLHDIFCNQFNQKTTLDQ